MATAPPIPNIDLGRAFDLRYEGATVHYEALSRLAAFFGRNMAAHRHDRVYQLHVLERGDVRLHLDEAFYQAQAPLFFLTPPAIPHAFVIGDDSEGHVLTVRQETIWQIMEADPGEQALARLDVAACVALPDARTGHGEIARRLLSLLAMVREEFAGNTPGREPNLHALTRLVFSTLCRVGGPAPSSCTMRAHDLRAYHAFNRLIESRFREHWTLSQYASALRLTETRLNDICRRVANLPSKRVVTDRLTQEAKRLLRYSNVSVNETAWQLGFKDVAYFCRVFRREIGQPPGQWREQALRGNGTLR